MHSMRARMTFFLALSIALFILLLSASYLIYARNSLERSFANSLDRIALESGRLARNGASLDQLRAQILAHNAQVIQSGAISESVEAWLLDSRSREIWRFGPPPRPRREERPPQAESPPPRDPPNDSNSRRKPPPFVSSIAPAALAMHTIPPRQEPDGWRSRSLKWNRGTLVLGLPWRRAQRDLQTQTLSLSLLCLLTVVAAACGAWILVGKTLRPIDALSEQARRAAAHPTQLIGQRAPLQPTSSDREMRNLVTTLNQMLDNVQEAALSKERFHTSASHELRTPLQALGGHLGVTLGRERSAAEYRQALEEAALQTARLSKLTGDLLLLNRLQTAATLPLQESVDVTEMGDIAIQRAHKTIEVRGLRLVAHWETLEIEALPSHVEILLGNLVENAAKYARSGGEIGIAIEAQTRSVRVWNQYESAQLQALQGELPRLFEPFFRPDSARASETGGNGLGLAICHTIAQANGWVLEIEAGAQTFSARIIFATQNPSETVN